VPLPEMIALGMILVNLGVKGRRWVRNRRKLVWPKNVIHLEPYLRKRSARNAVEQTSLPRAAEVYSCWHQTQ